MFGIHVHAEEQFMRQVVHKGAVKDAIWSYFKETGSQKGLREMKCENRQVGNVEQWELSPLDSNHPFRGSHGAN